MKQKPEVSIIISTYNSVEWLKKILWGYAYQDFKDFEIVIADDGSGAETKQAIAQLSPLFDRPIIHVWHEDIGFRKTIILNKAVEACSAEYILMSDGDCIPKANFVQVHLKHKEPGYFLSGGYFKLPLSISQAITQEDIKKQRCFDLKWLKAQGLNNSIKNKKLSAGTFESKFLNLVTPTKPTWNGHNASGWKQDIVAVNGFDERMQYGGEDRELGERLFNKGLKSKQIRYSAVCVHLDHARGYVKEEMLVKNAAIRKETKLQRKTYTAFGIKKDS